MPQLMVGDKCLLIQVNGLNFLTEKSNLFVLIEFAKTFKAEITLIELLESATVFTLDELVKHLCDDSITVNPIPTHKPLKVKIKPEDFRKERIPDIVSRINCLFQADNVCTAKLLQSFFPDLDKSFLASVLSKCVQKMRKEGQIVIRDKVSSYKIQPKAVAV